MMRKLLLSALTLLALVPSLSAFDGQDLPVKYRPQSVAPYVGRHFAPSDHMLGHKKSGDYIVYPEVCVWLGSLRYASLSGDSELLELMRARFDKVLNEESHLLPRKIHVDLNMFGCLPLELFLQTRDSTYLSVGLPYADTQWQCPQNASDEEKSWAAEGYSWQTRLWIDDMYMITIVQTQAYRATGKLEYLSRAAAQMALYLDRLQLDNGLFYHAPDVPFIWSRGDGWMAAGMTELLRVLPASDPNYKRILKGYRLMMSTLKHYQAPSGLWRQLIDKDDIWEETSGSGMFAYAIISGVNNGWLDSSYEEVARKAWMALVDKLDGDWNVTDVCVGTNKKNDLQYYYDRPRQTGDFHGQAPLMWCAAAMMEGTAVAAGGPAFDVTRYGVSRRKVDKVQTSEIQKVINLAGAYYRRTGERATVIFPKGEYLSGALFIRQGVDVILNDGAVLYGSTDISDYPLVMTRMEGRSRKYFPALVNADHCPGFTLSGGGVIDGNGEPYWEHFWLRRGFNPDCTNMDEMRPRMLFVSHSDGVSVKGLTLRNSPYWHTHFYKCNSLLLDGLSITAPHRPVHAPSTDAVDLDACCDVHITGCYMSVDDDAISFKGGKGPWADTEPENGPNLRCLIENCRFGYCQQVLTFGSESVRDSAIVMRDCYVDGPQRVLRFKMRPDTPQIYEDVTVERITGNAVAFLHIKPWTQFYDLGDRPDIARSVLRDVRIRDIDMKLSRFSDVTLKPEEYDVSGIMLDGSPLDLKGSCKMVKQSLSVPRIDGLDAMDVSEFIRTVESLGTSAPIDRVNWPAEWPLKPLCDVKVAYCAEGIALVYKISGETVRARELRDGGRIREDSCCGVLLGSGEDKCSVEVSASGAVNVQSSAASGSANVQGLAEQVKRWTSLGKGMQWGNIIDAPLEKSAPCDWKVCLFIPFKIS